MLEPIVLDASAWLAVLLEEDGATAIEAVLHDRTLFAPELIRYETANGILCAKRSGRSGHKKIPLPEFFEIILEFPIQIVPMQTWWKRSVELVEHYDLTFYDAAYIGIASALRIPILTMDKKVMKVVAVEKLETVHETHKSGY